MASGADLRVLFRACGGPRRGFGHLVRCRALARALGVPALVATRGTAATVRAAKRLGLTVVPGTAAQALDATSPHVLVVDDPVAADARRWIRAARARRTPVLSIHDLGLGCFEADLVVDGSVGRWPAVDAARLRAGLDFAILDPSFAERGARRRARRLRVLVTLGGGPRRARALAIARAIVRRRPDTRVRIAGGLTSRAANDGTDGGRVVWTGPLPTLREELLHCDVVVTAGGVTLYEACATATAAVAVPVVAAQAPTVRGFAALGACVGLARRSSAATVAVRVVALLDDDLERARLGRRASRTVDGRGALRVAALVRASARMEGAA